MKLLLIGKKKDYMKNKNYLKFTLIFMLILSLIGCTKKENVVGLLGDFDKESKNLVNKVLDTDIDIDNGEIKRKYIEFDNINTLLLALKSTKVSHVIVDETTARYFTKRQTGFSYEIKDENKLIKYSLCFKEDKKDLCDKVSAIIDQLSNEGFLNIIKINYIDNVINGVDPGALNLVHFDDKEVYKIGVTGDLPPMDYIDKDGRPAGYNVALLNEISKRLKVNFELVDLDTGAKSSALSRGKVDAIFWIRSFDENHNDAPKGTIFSTPYYQSPIADLIIK